MIKLETFKVAPNTAAVRIPWFRWDWETEDPIAGYCEVKMFPGEQFVVHTCDHRHNILLEREALL